MSFVKEHWTGVAWRVTAGLGVFALIEAVSKALGWS